VSAAWDMSPMRLAYVIATRLLNNLTLLGQRRDDSDRPGSKDGCQQGYFGGEPRHEDLTRRAFSEMSLE